MPSRKKEKLPIVKPPKTSKSTGLLVRKAGKRLKSDPAPSCSPPHGTKAGLRSRSTTKSAQPFSKDPESILRKRRKGGETTGRSQVQDRPETLAPPRGVKAGLRSGSTTKSAQPLSKDPESILRKRRKGGEISERRQAQDRPKTLSRDNLDELLQSVETLFEGNNNFTDSSPPEESLDEEISSRLEDTNPEETFNRGWGYLPPLDEEAAAVIDAIIADYPAMVRDFERIGPMHEDFQLGLEYRNVATSENMLPDPCADQIDHAPRETWPAETNEEKVSYELLWTLDQANCLGPSNEALFQRTFMMSLVARHCLIYQRDASRQKILDFSVEEPWTCPPMPTRAYYKKDAKFLTQPKPDLAVCFCRSQLIPQLLWNRLPIATQRLACYENKRESSYVRAFHFLTIEAKKGLISTDDSVAKLQSLNNASQALHNMYEFFREAGPQHEAVFFSEVRFFSVVANTEGLTIRIHRAVRELADHLVQGAIAPGYPLRFEYREFKRLQKGIDFKRDIVLETFEKICLGYAENRLFPLLKKAAEAIVEKFDNDPAEKELREDSDYYRYEQTKPPPKTNKNTPRATRPPTTQGDAMSVDRVSVVGHWVKSIPPSISRQPIRSGTATPKLSKKRTRSYADEDVVMGSADSGTAVRKRQKESRGGWKGPIRASSRLLVGVRAQD